MELGKLPNGIIELQGKQMQYDVSGNYPIKCIERKNQDLLELWRMFQRQENGCGGGRGAVGVILLEMMRLVSVPIGLGCLCSYLNAWLMM